MKYNKWKEANDYWRMVINKPFNVKGRDTMLLNYIENYHTRLNKSNYVTKTMHRFIKYLNSIGKEIYYYVAELNGDKYYLIYRDTYKKYLIGINPFISITREQIKAINNFTSAFARYNHVYHNRYKLRKSIINDLLDAIDGVSSIYDVLRQHRYNKTHKRKHPYPLISDNYIVCLGYAHTEYYDNYKQFSLNCLKQKTDITKTFYKYNPLNDIHNIFNKRPSVKHQGFCATLYNYHPF